SRGARTDPPAGSRHRRILGAGRGPRPAGSPTVGFEAQEKTLDVVAPRAPGLLELQVGRPRALGQAIPAGSPGGIAEHPVRLDEPGFLAAGPVDGAGQVIRGQASLVEIEVG